jgi:hypothetical protein
MWQANFMGQPLRVGRPKNYDGPDITPIPGGMAMPGMMGMGAAMPGAASQTDTLMLMNIPLFMDEPQIMELLSAFGELKTFNLMKDEKGVSLGSAVFEYKEAAQTDVALKGLNGLDIGDNKLSVVRAPATPGLTLTAVKTEEELAKAKEEEEAAAKLEAAMTQVQCIDARHARHALQARDARHTRHHSLAICIQCATSPDSRAIHQHFAFAFALTFAPTFLLLPRTCTT